MGNPFYFFSSSQAVGLYTLKYKHKIYKTMSEVKEYGDPYKDPRCEGCPRIDGIHCNYPFDTEKLKTFQCDYFKGQEIIKPKITWKNFWIWFKDQWKRDRFFYNMFISRNAWGAFSVNSHINQHTGLPKVAFSLKSAAKAADKMSEKKGVHFSYYKCLYCDGYHIGKNKDNKIEGYDK